LRILVILNGSIRGYSGGDLHAVAVANEWSQCHTVEMVLPTGSSFELGQLIAANVLCRRPLVPRLAPARGRLLLEWFLRTLQASTYIVRRRGSFDVVLASSPYPFDTLPAMLAGKFAKRVVHWHHHLTARASRPWWLSAMVGVSERLTAKLIAATGSLVITSNSQTRAWLATVGVPARAIHMTRIGSSLGYGTASRPQSQELKLVDRLRGSRFVLFSARLTLAKGTGDMRVICPNVLREHPDVRFIICGPVDADEAPLRESLKPYELKGSVVFPGFVSEWAKTWLFQHAHVLIAPSYEEGWGVSVSDGTKAGCWVVAYDLPALREACPEGPVFVELGNVTAFARATSLCLSRPRPSEPLAGAFAIDTWGTIADDELRTILS
jgi:glycosyltransferase involved in cell wall biosynthesis